MFTAIQLAETINVHSDLFVTNWGLIYKNWQQFQNVF